MGADQSSGSGGPILIQQEVQQRRQEQERRQQQQQRQSVPRISQPFQQAHQQQFQNQRQPQNYQEYNQMYRRISQNQRNAQNPHAQQQNAQQDLKEFSLQSYVHPESIKTQISDGNMLQLNMKVDSKVNCNVRISICVTEEKNDMNVPVMFFTPNKQDYVQNVNMLAGMKQEIHFGEVEFLFERMRNQELTKVVQNYYPLIVSINYNSQGQNYAFICYCVFTVNGNHQITGVRTVKQVVLIAGMPFEIKSIFGLSNDHPEEGENAKQIEGQKPEEQEDKECTICLSDQSDTIIMPCGHMCVCMPCGRSLQASKHNLCPVCRGAITTLIPFKKH